MALLSSAATGFRSAWRKAALACFLVLPAGCERGCARDWLSRHGAIEGVPGTPGTLPINAIDCPDGLARCRDGVVEVSVMAAIPQPCPQSLRPLRSCECPWSPGVKCKRGCAGEGVEVVIEPLLAARQLCAPSQDASTVTVMTPGSGAPGACGDGELYRCSGSRVVACRENAVIGTCSRGCFDANAYLEDDIDVSREAAFAILCLR